MTLLFKYLYLSSTPTSMRETFFEAPVKKNHICYEILQNTRPTDRQSLPATFFCNLLGRCTIAWTNTPKLWVIVVRSTWQMLCLYQDNTHIKFIKGNHRFYKKKLN